MEQLILFIAMACHEANKAWCESVGDYSLKHWHEAEEWQRESAIKGVQFRLDNPNASESSQHDSWMAEKVAAGWVYGETKDAEAKTHPCIVPFHELPEYQQKKDKLFCAIVDALKPAQGSTIPQIGDGTTEGEYRVRTKFNPSASGNVDQIKQASASLINLVNNLKLTTDYTEKDHQSFGRLKSLAMTAVEEGAMWAVKAATI